VSEQRPNMDDLKCRQCGKPITRTRDWKAFCNFECRMAWHNAMRHEAITRWWEQREEESEPEEDQRRAAQG
jgi:hypothetical protein